MGTTESIARGVIADVEGASSTPADVEANASTNHVAAHHPGAAMSEIKSLMGDGENTHTRRVAAAMVAKSEGRPWVTTPYGGIRRAHDANGSRTSQVAREVIDADNLGALASPSERANRDLHDGLSKLQRELESEQ